MATTTVLLGATLAQATPAAATSARAGHGPRTSLITVTSTGGHTTSYHGEPFWVSADGRYVGFASLAADLVAGDTNELWDLFIRDRWRRTTSRIAIDSHDAHSAGGNSMSPNGRYLAYVSDGPGLVPGDTNDTADVFLRDNRTGNTRRVSVSSTGAQADKGSYEASVSADGRYVAFSSEATNLVPHDTNDAPDIFLHDVRRGTTTRISVSATGKQGDNYAFGPMISHDGRYIGFSSRAANLVPGDRNGTWDVFLRDRRTDTLRQVSVSRSGARGNGASEARAMTPDARYIIFFSDASNLASGDTNHLRDVLVWDRHTRRTSLISVDSKGRPANGESDSASVSPDGRYVAFGSIASNLVVGDTNQTTDVFVRDRRKGTTHAASFSATGTAGDSTSISPAINATGRYVAYFSYAGNLAPGDSPDSGDVLLSAVRYGPHR